MAGALGGGPPAQKNVLFLIADDLTATALACYGNPLVQTPNLDALAARGMLFERAYCQYPVCNLSRPSMMRGTYPPAPFNAALPRWPEHFRNNGYTSMRVSKIYHMRVPGDITSGANGSDHAASWDTRVNVTAPEWQTTGTVGHYTTETVNTNQPTTHYNLGFGAAFYAVESNTSGVEQADYIAVDEAITLMEAADTAGDPFLLAVGLVRPHVPLVAPSSYFAPYDPLTIPLADSVPNDLNDIPGAGRFWNEPSRGPLNDPDRRKILQAYYASVAFMDAQVGRLLTRLQQLGLENDTIVVFTSDHGFHLGEHTFWQKLSLHDESAKVPFIMAGPGIATGRTEALAQLVDLYPTLTDMAGIPTPTQCQGLSLRPVLEDASAEVHSAVYTQISNGKMLRTDRWAYMSYSDGSEELYDMRNDPKQFTNRIADPNLSGIKFQLSAQLDEAFQEMLMSQTDLLLAVPSFCDGDGGDQVGCTNCPCMNNAVAGSKGGCLNSSGSGTRLHASGDPSVSLIAGSLLDLRFSVSGAPPTAFCILNSGDNVAPLNMANPCFGLNSGVQALQFDGLRCAVTNTRRHGGRSADADGNVGETQNPWGGEGGPNAGIAGSSGFVAGQTRSFQIINRDDPLLVCMRGLNTSQALSVTMTP